MHAAAVVARAGLALIAITTCATAVAADASACYGAYYTHVEVLQAAPNHVIVSASAQGTGYVTRDEYETQFADIFDQIRAYAEGAPINVVNPAVLETARRRGAGGEPSDDARER